MKLYFNPQSRAVIAKWMLDECDADYQLVTIDLTLNEHKRADYLKINPAGKLPALVDNVLGVKAERQRGWTDLEWCKTVIERELGAGPYLLGEQFTAADVMI